MPARAIDKDRARNRRARATVRKLKAVEERKPAKPEVALHDYDEKFLECRDLGHPWRVLGFFRLSGEIRRSLVCQRCHTESTDVWRPNGERITRRYRYQAGYQLTGSHVSRFDVRRETLKRVTVYPSQQDMVAALFSSKGRKKRAG